MGNRALAPAGFAEFDGALKRTAQRVDEGFDAVLPARAGDRLRKAMRYAVLGQGKRLRPFLLTQSAALFDVNEHHALRAALALEAVHCYSLVHDDLPAMDDDDLRRGRPTVHRRFDEATAILVGDGLQALAFEILADPHTHPDATVRANLVGKLASSAGEGGMVGGQMLDIAAERGDITGYDAISAMQGMKTGALFRFACEAGAILGQADATPLVAFAEQAGLAFQIADDVLDVEATAEQLGKATGKDQAKGKATFVDLLGLDDAKAEARRLVDGAIASLAPYGGRAALLAAAAEYFITRAR